ncbi:hypothetical protein PHAVU_004G080500 [Phaseolus vulgaris]|uniref:Uncharacterized protein n=1 Tax=Phaseolus vulgaris TaxID=3885 RepID=V7C0Z9_PHAVU|nr:hypothetical protein PHAVU_004G080500g [Phaseolus vulgaris]ESW23842.1 hypothetical protein PHAVU_004G080500g [Phaseolus vulgaris]
MGFNIQPYGIQSMLMEDHRYLSGLDEATNTFPLLLELPLVPMTVQILDALVEEGSENMEVRDKEQIVSRMKAAVASKQFGLENTICSDPFYYEKVVW